MIHNSDQGCLTDEQRAFFMDAEDTVEECFKRLIPIFVRLRSTDIGKNVKNPDGMDRDTMSAVLLRATLESTLTSLSGLLQGDCRFILEGLGYDPDEVKEMFITGRGYW